MKIGYPCINWTIGCKGDKTFRLRSYSEQRLKATVQENLDCLSIILQFNIRHGILFFRITSDLVPFASHPVNKFNWEDYFRPKFEEIGDVVRKSRMRISMHPDQFTLINSIGKDIFKRSCNELAYHSRILDLMRLDTSAKIQIHVGGIYRDKKRSTERFVRRYFRLEDSIRRRLVIENDDRLYNFGDCIEISNETGLPVLLDIFHHSINSTATTTNRAIHISSRTWKQKTDGIPMVDYSSRRINGLPRQHAESIDKRDFGDFLSKTFPLDFDVMLEIKDKEKSAIKALSIALRDSRLQRTLESCENELVK